MKIRALRTLRNDAGLIKRGAEAEVSQSDARSLIKRGLAEAADEPAQDAPEADDQADTKPKGKTPAKGAKAPKEGE